MLHVVHHAALHEPRRVLQTLNLPVDHSCHITERVNDLSLWNATRHYSSPHGDSLFNVRLQGSHDVVEDLAGLRVFLKVLVDTLNAFAALIGQLGVLVE